MSKASEVIAIAKSQIGYIEKASNSQLDDNTANAGTNNWTKYARDLAAAGYYNGNKNGFAWCDVFVDWCFFKAYGAVEGQRIQCQTGDCGAGCTFSQQYYKAQGRLDMNPKVGDQIFFRYSGSSGADHTGIVVEVTSSQIVTVEGNSNNRVGQNTYSRNYNCIVGYGHPKYSETDGATEVEAAQPTQQAQPAGRTRTYTVKAGDCLWTIAKEQLGSGARYTEIVALNGLKTSLILVGQKLQLPTA